MRIGIVDDFFFSLQSRLLDDGHALYIFAGSDAKGIPSEQFNVTPNVSHNIVPVASVLALVDEECDFYITGTAGVDPIAYEVLKTMSNNVLGHDQYMVQLEVNRDLAFRVLQQQGLTDILSVPEAFEIYDAEAAYDYVANTAGSMVLKQTSGSPSAHTFPMCCTTVSRNGKQTASIFKRGNPFFHPDGNGGVRIEQFVSGYEVSFGAWFDGREFLSPFYSCIEHKGPQNGDRGGNMTGEIGSTHVWHHEVDFDASRIGQMLRKLEPALRGHCNGMIDINCILDPATGKLWFLEFTMRYGRPTLEMMLALTEKAMDYGDVLHKLATHDPNAPFCWAAAQSKQHAVGVNVFLYGHPVLDYVIDRADNKEEIKKLLPAGFDFEPPLTEPGKSEFIQMMARFDHAEQTWRTDPGWGRQFVIVGLGDTAETARLHAYQPLQNYDLINHTWRDDIGAKFQATLDALHSFRYF